ncbi:MAG TPA: NADPH-dependent FMN reductase [Cyclobacteriaceae bacterium]
MEKIKLLGISGSLRSNSSTQLIMNAVQSLAGNAVDFKIYEGLASLPPFDDSNNVPGEVEEFRKQLREADGVFFISPEYAFGVPGSLKNALDWTVSSGELVSKPAALVVAATGGENAYHSWQLIFKALSLKINEESKLLISFIRSKLNHEGKIKDFKTEEELKNVLNNLIQNIPSSTPS